MVAKGFTKKISIDYFETFSPLAKMNTIKIMIALAANKGWDLHLDDVNHALLHGKLDQLIFLSLPLGYESKFTPEKVVTLHKIIYGLNQSPRAWFSKFCQTMIKFRHKQESRR